MEFLFVSGFGQNIDDGSKIWDLAGKVAARGVNVTKRTCGNDLKPWIRTAKGPRKALVYSYGMADWHKNLWEVLNAHEVIEPIDKLYIVVGVNRLPDGQGSSVWHIPPIIRAATAFNTDPIHIPTCRPIRNESDLYKNIWCQPVGFGHITIWNLPIIEQTVLGELGVV